MRAHGYQPATPSLISWTGLLLAPIGGYAFNLAAITAAICMGKEVDPDANRRWPAAVWAGCIYLLTGCFGATVVALPTFIITASACSVSAQPVGGCSSDLVCTRSSHDRGVA